MKRLKIFGIICLILAMPCWIIAAFVGAGVVQGFLVSGLVLSVYGGFWLWGDFSLKL